MIYSPLCAPEAENQAFLLISSRQSPMLLWDSINNKSSEIARHEVTCLWSAPLYGPHGASLYVTAASRQQIELVAEALQRLIAGIEIDIRLCKNDGQSHSLVPASVSSSVQGLVGISLLHNAGISEVALSQELQQLAGARHVRACYGESDIMMLLSASNLDAFRDVLHQVRTHDCVATNSTRLVYALHAE